MRRCVIDEVVTVSAARGGPARTAALGGHCPVGDPPGAVAVSDPVPLAHRAGDEVAVACYAAGRRDRGAYLHSAQRTGHAAPGNQAGRGQLDGLDGAQSFSSLYWITRVLTDAPAGGPVIVALGELGQPGATWHDGRRRAALPRSPAGMLLAAGLGGAVVLNAGLGANRLLRPRLGPAMTDRFDRDVLGVAEATHVIIMGGLNDLGLPALLGGPRPTAGQLIDGLLGPRRPRRQRGHPAGSRPP